MHLVEPMAYAGEQPWHGLGNRLAPGQSIEQWRHGAGMEWSIEEAEVRFVSGHGGVGTLQAFPDQKILYRSDTKRALAVVSKRFQVVQPREILEFYLTALPSMSITTVVHAAAAIVVMAAWFGQGAQFKLRAWNEMVELVA